MKSLPTIIRGGTLHALIICIKRFHTFPKRFFLLFFPRYPDLSIIVDKAQICKDTGVLLHHAGSHKGTGSRSGMSNVPLSAGCVTLFGCGAQLAPGSVPLLDGGVPLHDGGVAGKLGDGGLCAVAVPLSARGVAVGHGGEEGLVCGGGGLSGGVLRPDGRRYGGGITGPSSVSGRRPSLQHGHPHLEGMNTCIKSHIGLIARS
ncbi:hypothetical protein DFP73DRAFT_565148 [Morchella snyderi]|nr:hypothetical protein DFP73DRAFT_565148 [Morchella snyderi]